MSDGLAPHNIALLIYPSEWNEQIWAFFHVRYVSEKLASVEKVTTQKEKFVTGDTEASTAYGLANINIYSAMAYI